MEVQGKRAPLKVYVTEPQAEILAGLSKQELSLKLAEETSADFQVFWSYTCKYPGEDDNSFRPGQKMMTIFPYGEYQFQSSMVYLGVYSSKGIANYELMAGFGKKAEAKILKYFGYFRKVVGSIIERKPPSDSEEEEVKWKSAGEHMATFKRETHYKIKKLLKNPQERHTFFQSCE